MNNLRLKSPKIKNNEPRPNLLVLIKKKKRVIVISIAILIVNLIFISIFYSDFNVHYHFFFILQCSKAWPIVAHAERKVIVSNARPSVATLKEK